MKSLKEEIDEFQREKKLFGILKKKTESISRLKLSFFEKLKAAEEAENIHKAREYALYLQRATALSKKVYSRIDDMILEVREHLQVQVLEFEHLEEIDPNNILGSLDREMLSYINSVQDCIDKLYNKDRGTLIKSILSSIPEQLSIIDSFDHSADTLFRELEMQSRLHELLIIEKREAQKILDIISTFEKQTMTYIQRISEIVKMFNNQSKLLVRNLKNKPLQTVFQPFERAGLALEKRASIFAATIFGFSIAGTFALLTGSVAVATACDGIILLLAEIGEPLQAIPAMKNGISKMKEKIVPAIKFFTASKNKILEVS